MRDFVYSLMTDKKKGAIYIPLKLILYILSLVYGLAILLRGVLYKYGVFKSHKVPVKVISVGNLTLGGTGKTPFVIMLSKILRDDLGKEACILIRGYGWDEQAMLKQALFDIPVLVGEDRARSAHKAIRLYGSQTAILDDGFQHWELERDLDIVLIDSRNPFGNGHLFPRGILREPGRAAGRADIIVFTKVDKRDGSIGALKESLKGFDEDLIFFEAAHRPKNIRDPKNNSDLDLSFLKGKRVVLLSGIGDPSYFEETVKGLGAKVLEHVVFGDHHDYRQSDADLVVKRCDERSFDLVLTTEKDMVKFSRMHLSFGKYNVMALAVEMEIISGREMLIDRLNSLYSRKGA